MDKRSDLAAEIGWDILLESFQHFGIDDRHPRFEMDGVGDQFLRTRVAMIDQIGFA